MKIEKKRYFFTGLLVVLPVLATVYLFISLFSFFDNILGRYISKVTIAYLGIKIPGLGLLVFLVLIFVTGFFATNFIGRKLLLYLEGFWFKFPLVKKVYPAAKQVTKFLFGHKIQGQVQKVVLIQIPPRTGLYTIGFLTNQSDKMIQDKTGRPMVNVLVPTVPNPLTGFLIFVPQEEVVVLDIGIEDAIKMVVSGGVLNPKDLIERPLSFED
jgi:uncharacterized membrane protein